MMWVAIRRFTILVAFLIFMGVLARPSYGAGIYYIDCANGSDTNSGTSSASAWKHDPTMPGSTVANYAHATGDVFYFKGGVACSVSSMWTIGTGGSNSAFDYRGASPAWGTGTTTGFVTTNGTSVYYYGDFTHTGQPFVTLGNAWAGASMTINGSSYTIASCATQWTCTLTSSAGVQSGPVSYSVAGVFALPIVDFGANSSWSTSAITVNGSFNTLDSLELRNWSATSPAGYGQSVVFVNSVVVNISNSHIHGWGVTKCSGDCAADGNDDGIFNYNGTVTVTGTTMHARQDSGSVCQKTGGTSYCSTGNAMYGVNIVANCYVYDVFAFFHGPNVVHDTYMSWMNSGEDTAVHENGIYCFGSCTGFNNVIHDFIGVPAIYWETYDGTGTVPSTVYFYNNVLWNASQPFLAEPDRAPSGGPYKDVQNIWNNTIFAPGGNCVRTTPRGTNSGTWNLHNNHCISNQSLSVSYVSANSTTFNLPASNILMATATATSGGYSATETFAFSPSSSNSPTLTVQGENLSSSCSGSAAAACWDTSYANGRAPSQRTSSGSWNVGAYAVAGGSRGGNAVNPPTALSAVVN